MTVVVVSVLLLLSEERHRSVLHALTVALIYGYHACNAQDVSALLRQLKLEVLSAKRVVPVL